MEIKMTKRISRNGKRFYYTFEWKRPGKWAGSGYFTYVKPKNTLEKTQIRKHLPFWKGKGSTYLREPGNGNYHIIIGA